MANADYTHDHAENSSGECEIVLRVLWSLSGEHVGDVSLCRTSTAEALCRQVAGLLQESGFVVVSWKGKVLEGKQTLADIGLVENVEVQVTRGAHPIFGKWKCVRGIIGGVASDYWNGDEIEILADESTRLPAKVNVYVCHGHPDGAFEMECSAEFVAGSPGRSVLMKQYLPACPALDGDKMTLACRMSFDETGDIMIDVRRERAGGEMLLEPESDEQKHAEFWDPSVSSRHWHRIDAR